MSEKANLKDSRQYRVVFIHHDQSREQRLMTSNFKAVLDALNRNDKDLSLHGTRIVRRTQEEGQNRQAPERGQSPRERGASQPGNRRPNDTSNAESNRGRSHGNGGNATRRGNDRG